MPTKMENIGDGNGTVRLIQGFSELFGAAEGTLGAGIRTGATLLVSGPPGSGKTTFALAMVRALMAQAVRDHADVPGKKVIAYYISSEVDEKTLKRAYESFGWFARGKSDGSLESFLFRIDDPVPDKTNFYAITPMPEVDRPVPSPEELVNGIFNRIAHTLSPSEAPSEDAQIYVIVDSISALLKGCANPGEERRQTHEIMHRLRDRFGTGNLFLSILIAEQDHRAQDAETSGDPIAPTNPSVEDYLADIVFRLYVRSLPLGRRSRVLEVVKSQGVNMILGEHSWQIITEDNFKQILRHEGMQLAVKKAYFESIEPAMARKQIEGSLGSPVKDAATKALRWGGIIIFPRPQLQRPVNRRARTKELPLMKSGTNGLEDVRRGTTTLIAGPVGSGKTTLCKQFLKAPTKTGGRPVLVSFDIFPANPPKDVFDVLDFTQTKFDLNVLVAHIGWILGGDKKLVPHRLAFDGLSEWITMFDEPEAARMLEALMITVMQSGRAPAVFMTYALGIYDDPLGPHALGMNAENIVVVRQIAINDQLRRILYFLKSDGGRSKPEVPRELILKITGDSSIVEVVPDTLDFYTGLLGRPGDLKAAKVLLLLFAENDQEEKLNKALYDALVEQHAGRLEISYSHFSRSEIGSTLDREYKNLSPGEAASLKVQSVDEWWLGTEGTDEFLCDIRDVWQGMETVRWSDYWSFEVEKATFKPKQKRGGKSGETSDKPGAAPNQTPASQVKNRKAEDASIHAVPAYMDFGMLCINRGLWLEDRGRSAEKPAPKPARLRDHWLQILSDVPRLWTREKQLSGFDWFEVDVNTKDERTLVEYALYMTKQEKAEILKRKPIFTFDMATRETCVCAFLEFAWAFGASEAMLGLSEGKNHQAEMDGAFKALTFLQFMVLEGLMPERGTIEAAKGREQTLFSRHFYSTLTKAQDDGTPLIALPFMPTGLTDCENAVRSAIADIRSRLGFWLGRARSISSAADQGDLDKITEWQERDDSDASNASRLKSALQCYGDCRNLVLKLAGRGGGGAGGSREAKGPRSSGNTADTDDLIELTTWAAFRLQLLVGGNDGRFPTPEERERERTAPTNQGLARAMSSMETLQLYLPDLSGITATATTQSVLTGYGCTGSWMYGVSKKSRAPALQSQMLREMTSLEWAEERARHGGGMPARKDFFQLRGGEEVPGMDYLNWREFLRYNGSRARRRDRVLAEKQNTHSTYTVIQRELLACLRVAGLHMGEYAAAVKEYAAAVKADDDAAIATNTDKLVSKIRPVTERSKAAVRAIFRSAYKRNNRDNSSAAAATPQMGTR
jgi:KaiC/GvpD/RAD55 family RecA-like ATPase